MLYQIFLPHLSWPPRKSAQQQVQTSTTCIPDARRVAEPSPLTMHPNFYQLAKPWHLLQELGVKQVGRQACTTLGRQIRLCRHTGPLQPEKYFMSASQDVKVKGWQAA